MPRLAAVAPDQIRAAVLSMLAEAGDAEPPTGERFRKIVSVRKLRARLGAGDPATLSGVVSRFGNLRTLSVRALRCSNGADRPDNGLRSAPAPADVRDVYSSLDGQRQRELAG
jgi:Plasmid replication region DNA-binding N-term.